MSIRIALDAMGGDYGPEVIVPGAALACQRNADLDVIFFGDQSRLEPLLSAYPIFSARSSLVHTDVAIKMDDKPSQALRYGRKNSSMWLAIEAVKCGRADAAVSAGNTGALMAMAKICLNTLPLVDRPALAALWPTLRGRSVVLDLGASIGADAEQLVTLATMGAAMARIVLQIDRPTVALLNIGVEEVKGIEEVKAASRILRNRHFPNMTYHGFVEGDDLGKGTADVVVIEGFTGNIALKTAEGTAKQITTWLRQAMGKSWISKLGYFFAQRAFGELKEKLDPRNINGAVFLGLDGIVVKSHGAVDAQGICAAIEIAYKMVNYELLTKTRTMLSVFEEASPIELIAVAADPRAG